MNLENLQGKFITFEGIEGCGKSTQSKMLVEYLNNNGELWVVIRKNQGADSAKKKMSEVYGNCEIMDRSKGFYILKSVC